jgi:hypothetical protein
MVKILSPLRKVMMVPESEATDIAASPDDTQTQPAAGIPEHLQGVDSNVKLGTVPCK